MKGGIESHKVTKNDLPSPVERGSNMASKESGCEGGDVKLWPPVQKKKTEQED